ncbi:hypothetical protein [Prevotella sp.]|uniref:hypothetical protein n=1 Tax=Prevotella sp. TaxID=59823 RepID=UPI001CB5CA0E|nr:hypothetical protein [Prevotella sp.]MBF1624201.1 hypothetical protein [Prevotella sp.]
MKKLFYSFIAVFALLFTGCADKDVVEAISNGDNQPGVTVSMSMEGDMGQTAATRAIGYETDDTKGFPTPVGIFDKGTSEGKEIADGTKVDVLLIFKSSDDTQPVTKVVTKWTYKKGGNLTLLPSETFEMKSGTDLSKGTWYVCGILGGEMLPGNDQVKFNGFSEGHTARNSAGEKLQWGANIPYIFGWRKLTTNAANKTIKAEKAVKFKQFGSIVRLKVTNNTGFNFKYNGVRIITSNILCGQFDLSSFDDKDSVKSADLKDTEDADVVSAKSESYKKVFKPFKFYQRPLDDNAMTGEDGLIKKRRFRIYGNYIANYTEEKAKTKLNTALTYYDHTFLPRTTGANAGDNFDNVENGQEAPSYIYVWMAPQQQAVKIYNGDTEGTGDYKVKKVAKTQFLLMAVPTETSTETSTGTKIVPTSINMLPAYGTLADYVSGANYPAKGNVVYEFAPLSYVAKHDNFGTEAELSNAGDQDVAHTKRYTYNQDYEGQEKISDHLSSIPGDYFFANNEYWRSIIPHYYGFAGFRNGGNDYKNFCMGIVSPVQLPGWNGPKLVYHSYSKGVPGSKISYMLGMSKKPDYINIDQAVKGEGQSFKGYAKQPSLRAYSGITTIPDWIDNNKYRFTIRYEDVNGTAVLTQRYLGPRFVLDMDDIANEDFWAAPSNNSVVYPEDVKRVFPYSGVNSAAEANGQTIWFYDTNTVGKMTQYWTPDNTAADGLYTPKGSTHKGAMLGLQGVLPKQSVTFVGSNGGSETGGFFQHYLYVNVPVNGDHDNADPRYKKNFIMSAPVRLWRKTTPYAD